MKYEFDPDKNIKLKKERGITFDEIITIIEIDIDVLDIILNPNYQDQFIYVIYMKNYVYAVPCIIKKNVLVLKTAYPDRRLVKKYIKGINNETKNS